MSIENILLNNWLNNELKFEPKISDIRIDFKNGYYFGELLSKLELISDNDFNFYKNSDNLDDVNGNYSLLEKHLNDILNIKLRKEEIDDIINLKNRNNIILLLYRIKNSYYKHKIHFNDIKDSIQPMSQKQLSQKVQLILECNNDNELIEDNKIEENFFYQKEKIIKPKRIKIQKVMLSSHKKNELSQEKVYMKKRMILPKIQNEPNNFQDQNYDSRTVV